MVYSDAHSPSVVKGLTHNLDYLFHEDLSKNHSRRMDAYHRYWKFYHGRHWSYERDPGEEEVTVNYCRKAVDKHISFCFKHGFLTSIPDDPSTPENESDDRDFVRVMLEETWRKNNKKLWMLEAGQQGGVSGDLFMRVSWEKNDPLEDAYARVDIIPSHMCYPEFGGPHGVDRKKIRRMLIVVPVFREESAIAVSGRHYQHGSKTAARVKVVMTSEEWLPAVYVDGVVKEPAKVILREDGNIIDEKVNPLGEIPVVHVPNYPITGEYYGMSDLVDATDLNKSINERTTDIGDIIAYHSAPTTIVFGAKLSDLERGVGKMWGLPGDARVENLELKGDLNAARSHTKELKSAFMEMTDLPEASLGAEQSISNTAGVTMQLQYMPMIERRAIKVLTYGTGIRLVNRLIMKTTALADLSFGDKFNALKGNKYRNDVKFPDPMPQDKRRDLEISREELDQGLTTRKHILEERGRSQTEIKDILDGVKKERLEEAEMMFSSEGPGSGNATFDRGGANETMGEKISSTVARKDS